MKKTVQFSTFSFITTIISYAIIIGLGIYLLDKGVTVAAYVDFAIVIFLLLAALFYVPLGLTLTDNTLDINRSLRIKILPLTDIESVRLCPPTMGAKRICGSGGFMGYWGWSSERDLGKYFAYYGKASDCFLVRMKDGRQYMLGCKDAPERVSAIQSKL